MKVRSWINHNSLLVTCAALAMLVSSLLYLQTSLNPPTYTPPVNAYFYDTVTNELFVSKFTDIPPIATPAQNSVDDHPAGVKAFVFSCSSCNDTKSRYIGYLETFTETAKEAQIKLQEESRRGPSNSDSDYASSDQAVAATTNPASDPLNAYTEGHLIATSSSPNTWHKEGSEKASEILSSAMTKCPRGTFPAQCLPDDR